VQCLVAASQFWDQPCARQERVSPASGGEEGDGDRKGRVATEETLYGRVSTQLHGQAVPSVVPVSWKHEVLLNLAQNKQPHATGPPKQTAGLFSRRTGKWWSPFSSGPVPEQSSSINSLSTGWEGAVQPGTIPGYGASSERRVCCIAAGFGITMGLLLLLCWWWVLLCAVG